MVFSKRMEALADLCQGARRVIDVGCDHAQLCALLVTEYGVEHAFASDIRPGPLENARRTIGELGLMGKITPVLSDGLDAFGPGDGDTVIRSHAALDISVFSRIAGKLGIRRRFAGEEPFSHVTALYNRTMEEELPRAGLEFVQIPRRELNGTAISASRVRELIRAGRTEEIRPLVPETTYRYFTSEAGARTAERIRSSGDVVHY